MKRRLATTAVAALFALGPLGSVAGGPAASFSVRVTLLPHGANPPVGGVTAPSGSPEPSSAVVCTSMVEEDERYAFVRVLCTTTAPYVEIEPAPGQGVAAWAGVSRTTIHNQSPATSILGGAGGFHWKYDTGILTALQVSNAASDGSALEMLVSF